MKRETIVIQPSVAKTEKELMSRVMWKVISRWDVDSWLVMLMKTPEDMKYDNDRYIITIQDIVSDEGNVMPLGKRIDLVQLDKCLEQFHRGFNGESPDGKVDDAQLFFCMAADINDSEVQAAIQGKKELEELLDEVKALAEDDVFMNELLNDMMSTQCCNIA